MLAGGTGGGNGSLPSRRIAVALAPDHVELAVEEHEALPRIRDGAGFVDDQARDGGKVLVGQVPVEQAVEVANGDRAVDQL